MASKFLINRGKNGQIESISTTLKGLDLLDNPRLNKGSAFTTEERKAFGLEGKIPYHAETIEEQAARVYQQFTNQPNNLAKNIHLNSLHDNNETLFYYLVGKHLDEMLPIVYTPTVGDAVEQFSLQLRRPRGLYISYPDMGRIDEILANRSNADIDLMVVTDGEGVLGIGDQGIGGMDISIAKLMVYVLCAGVNPLRKLAVVLDVGTNNQHLLNDPMYLGWRHERISGEEYDEFIDRFIASVKKQLPGTYLHWEDFGRDNARKNLLRYRDDIVSFNDDMQGTGAITLAAILSALHAAKRDITKERVVFLGAGTAGVGIADQIADAMVRSGISEEEAHNNFWLIDKDGLLIDSMKDLASFQVPYARKAEEVASWNVKGNYPNLEEVIENVKPTILIGCSTVANAFNEKIVSSMAKHVKHPIIMPLSNPTSRAEAHPANLLKWTDGKALVATGSPFGHVDYEGKSIRISQCNNAFVFPGLGLGVIACKAKKVSDDMLWVAANALSQTCPVFDDPTAPLLPDFDHIKEISHKIAVAVIEQARKEGLAGIDDAISASDAIEQVLWEPKYYPYVGE